MAKKKAKSSSSGGSNNFFKQHVEKIVVGVVALLVVGLLYQGFTTKGYPTSKTPEGLKKEAENVLQQVRDVSHWDNIKQDFAQPIQYAMQAEASRSPINWTPYPTTEWEKVNRTLGEKRVDPALPAPMRIQVQTLYGALAVNVNEDTPDPFAEMEPADPLKKAARPPRDSGRKGNGGSSGMLGGFGSEGSGDDEEGSSDKGSPAMPSGGSGMMGGLMGGSAGMGRRLDPKYDLGYGSKGGVSGMSGYSGGMKSGGDDGDEGLGVPGVGSGSGGESLAPPSSGDFGGTAKRPKKNEPMQKPAVTAAYFNLVTAVVPHEENFENYRKAFENADGFNGFRDRPSYRSFQAERVDVTDDPNKAITEDMWKPLTDTIKQEKLIENWPGENPEVADRRFTDAALTMPIVPLMIRDYRKFAMHPDVPATGVVMYQETENNGQEDEEPSEETGEDEEDGFSKKRSGNRGAAGGSMGNPLMGGSSGSGMMGGYPGMDGGSYGSEGDGDDGKAGLMGSGGMMGGMMGSGGMMGGMMGSAGNRSTLGKAEAKYKLIRFYDTTVEAGHVYRYRVRVVVEDPNYPEDATLEPMASTLKADTLKRVSERRKLDQAETDKKKQQQADKNKEVRAVRTYYRFTDWSEQSEPAYARPEGLVFGGKVKPSNVAKIPVNVKGADPTKTTKATIEVETQTKGAEGKLAFADWNPTLAIEIPEEFAVYRGSILFLAKKDVPFVNPMSKDLLKLETHIFNAGAAVVEVRGSDDMASSEKNDTLQNPGEILILSDDGSLDALEELDDQFNYRMYSFADEKEAAAKAPPAGGMPSGPMGSGGSSSGEGGIGEPGVGG